VEPITTSNYVQFSETSMNDLRSIPSVDQLLQKKGVLDWIETFGRPLTIQAIRDTLDEVRINYSDGSPVPEQDALLERVQRMLADWTEPTLQAVINASGVILHTNLGRAPLSRSALQAIKEISSGYSNLEYDLDKGRRGSRTIHAEALLKRITGAQAGLIVNNNAAAVLLTLSALARRRSVVIARSQLVEIGGGFRIPDVMKQSGARLAEVGTTNRVHLSDYEQALAEHPAALIMRAHRSNFQIVGFTSEPTLDEMVGVAHRADIPVVDDLGSGSLLDTARFGLGHEPMVQESLSAGADLVCFSGDKLLGGPQAGIIVGRTDLVNKLKKHPLARAIRADKMCLAALSATLLHYLKDKAEREIPIWRMISTPVQRIKDRADQWRNNLGQGEVISGQATVGGGSLPGETLPTFLLSLSVPSVNRSLAQLRHAQIPVIGRAQEDLLLLDPRTVLPEQDAQLLQILTVILKGK
jgi:L-seryl-tRNA(Ser) seleniumtransferase